MKFALEAEGRSQNSLETSLKERGFLGKSRGAMSSLISGRRSKTGQMKVDVLAAIADILHVRMDWLVSGELPMKRDGRVEQTPFEIAMQWARNAGCREDAIQAAWAKLKEQAPTLGVFEWSIAFDHEARDLDMRKVPRPEAVVATHEAVRRTKRKLDLKREQADAAEEPAPVVAPPRRVSGGI